MKKRYKVFFILAFFLLLKVNCKALSYGGCDYNTVSNLKKLVNNINISYTYELKDNNSYFDVILSNIPKEVYFVDSVNLNTYNYNNTNNGELTISGYNGVTSGQYIFYVNNDVCNGVKLGTKYYNFPIYNTRFNSEECKDIPNYSLCKRWIQKYYSDYEFEKQISDYKKSLNSNDEKIEKQIKYKKDLFSRIIELYIKYYYYFLPAIILIFGAVIIISNRKGRFKI